MNPRLAALPLLFLPVTVAAQAPATASSGGVWLEVSAAAGGTRLTCGICDPSRELGPAVTAAVGAYASPTLRVGLEGSGWTHIEEDVREKVFGAGLVAQLHPIPDSGLHLIGALGWSGYRADVFTYDAVRITLGAGWDLPLLSGWVVGNRVALDASSFASLKSDAGPVATSVGLSVLRFGIYVRRQ